jgi:hypothetical protein
MKIKRINLLILFAAGLFFGRATIEADTTQNTQINNLLLQVENKIPANYRYPEAIVDSVNWKKTSEFSQLQNAIQGNWPIILQNVQTVAPSDVDKTILFAAFQSMPSDSYLQFLDQATGLAQNNVIDKRLLKWELFPSNKNVRGVLDYNYDKPVVKDILQKVKGLYSNDPNMVQYCNDALAGKTKKNAEAYFNDNPGDARPIPAQQQLSTGAATQRNTVLSNTKVPDNGGGQSSQSATIDVSTVAHHPLAVIVAGVIVLIIGGLFVWKKLF